MFDKDELEIWLEQGRIDASVKKILERCEDEEPELMQYWVYRKRIKNVPLPIAVAGIGRFYQMAKAASVPVDKKSLTDTVISNVCNAIWDRLSDEERQRLMRSI